MSASERTSALGIEATVAFYKSAKEQLSATAFQEEFHWQEGVDLQEFTESDLLREAAWVILCCGFRESVVRRQFSYLSLCFRDWESAAAICDNGALCRATALSAFRNVRKVEAILWTAQYVCDVGFDRFKRTILEDPLQALRSLPYIGEVTSYHLAKNLGADVAKPDRHLVRFAASQGFSDVHALCSQISQATGDPLRVVDVVLWRFLVETAGSANPGRSKHRMSITA